MEKEIAKELIKLDVLDRTNREESEALDFFIKDSEFPFETLGNYQNLVAIIAATSGLQPPAPDVKANILERLFVLRPYLQKKKEEILILDVDGEISQVQIFDSGQQLEPVELVEAITSDSVLVKEAKKKPSIDELRNNKSPITIKDPNFSNIHLILEDRKSKISKVKDVPLSSPVSGNSDSPSSVTAFKERTSQGEQVQELREEEKVNLESHTKIIPVESDLSVELTKHRLRKKKTFPLFKPSVLRRDRSRTILAASIVVVFSAVVYLVIALTQTSPVEVAETKTLPGKLINEKRTESTAQNLITVTEPGNNEKPIITTKVEKNEKPIVESQAEKIIDSNNEKPKLPEPSKSETSTTENRPDDINETSDVLITENLKERSIDLPVLPIIMEKKLEIESPYFTAVEEMPEPIGGIAAIQSKIVYPEIARRAGVEGRVFVVAYVDETGRVTKAEITKGIGSGCDEAAIDAVMKTKFKPGVQRGKPVKVKITIPILFKR